MRCLIHQPHLFFMGNKHNVQNWREKNILSIFYLFFYFWEILNSTNSFPFTFSFFITFPGGWTRVNLVQHTHWVIFWMTNTKINVFVRLKNDVACSGCGGRSRNSRSSSCSSCCCCFCFSYIFEYTAWREARLCPSKQIGKKRFLFAMWDEMQKQCYY